MGSDKAYYVYAEDDPKERKRIREILTDQGLTSFMNNTRWRELCVGIHELPFRPSYQVKFLGTDAPEWELEYAPEGESNWATDWESQLGIHIEWMKIAPRKTVVTHRGRLLEPKIEVLDCTGELLALFRRLRLPFVERAGFVILYGHGKEIEFDLEEKHPTSTRS